VKPGMLGQIARLGQNWIDGSGSSGLAQKGRGLEGNPRRDQLSNFTPCVEPGRPSPNPLLLQSRLQPTVIRICTGSRGWNCRSCRKIRSVNSVCLERSLAHQGVLGVPDDTGIIHTGVAVGGYAAPGHNEKKGRRNEQPHWINP
jgi:hypothetical protein